LTALFSSAFDDLFTMQTATTSAGVVVGLMAMNAQLWRAS